MAIPSIKKTARKCGFSVFFFKKRLKLTKNENSEIVENFNTSNYRLIQYLRDKIRKRKNLQHRSFEKRRKSKRIVLK